MKARTVVILIAVGGVAYWIYKGKPTDSDAKLLEEVARLAREWFQERLKPYTGR